MGHFINIFNFIMTPQNIKNKHKFVQKVAKKNIILISFEISAKLGQTGPNGAKRDQTGPNRAKQGYTGEMGRNGAKWNQTEPGMIANDHPMDGK